MPPILKRISFENYKPFTEKQTIEIKPITLLIGKNSAGKSSIAKLLPLLENSLSGQLEEPLLLNNNGVELGAEFRDLSHGKSAAPVKFEVEYEDGLVLGVSILQEKSKFGLTINEWRTNDLTLTYSPLSGYKDQNHKQYSCKFNGFIPKRIETKDGGIVRSFSFPAIDVDYIGPFRVLPDRHYFYSGRTEFSKIGVRGEYAYEMLGVSAKRFDHLSISVGDWYEQNFDNKRLIVEDRGSYFEILISDKDNEINIVDVGQGMNQALPLIVRANICTPNSIVVIEQPELHLHPAAHSDLAELFANSAISNDQSFLIETHSENFILRLRKLIADPEVNFSGDDLIIYWIDEYEHGQTLKEITINGEGTLSDWPEGVFEEDLKELFGIEEAIERQTAKK